MEPKVSVIIPCYNQGQYLQEAVDSVLASTYENIEIVIVNDGSTEYLDVLEKFSAPKTILINHENQGVSVARNNGIKASSGKYILPLDSDDKIHPTYIEKAVKILEENEKIGIVYCRAEYFGAETGEWELKEYKFPNCLWENWIFNSAMYRKSDWEKTNGYNSEMVYGYEDWEFWLSLIENGVEVYKINEILFYYRRSEISRSTSTWENRLFLYKKLIKLHPNLYSDNLEQIILPLNNILREFIPKKQSKEMYLFNLRKRLWDNLTVSLFIDRGM
ncbi:MAG: glycosyltransferase family A protein [Candidatus Gastranaerophilales bacterium]|nr:glycosyltransferase family A protein [Candidatus Gastranaerophilales bacterium]